MAEIKVCCCSHKCAWSLLLFLQLSAIGLVIASVFVPNFVGNDNFNTKMYECSDSGCPHSKWGDNKSSFCNYSSSSSGCKLFKGFEEGMYAYLICCGVAVISTFIWIFPSLFFMCRKNCFGCGTVFGLIAMCAQIAGVVSYYILVNVVFSGCNSGISAGSQPKMCAKEGAELSIVAGGVYILAFFFYLIFGGITRRKIKATGDDSDPAHHHNRSSDQILEKKGAWTKS